jgi:hypothetical protein
MTGITCALAGAGAPNYLGSVTVTVGTFSVPNLTRYGSEPSSYGSITPATWADSGLTISGLFYNINTTTSPTVYAVVMRITGYAPNAGWSTLTIAGNAYSRVDASYSYDGTFSSWVWSTTSTNPFGTTIGATKAVVWS